MARAKKKNRKGSTGTQPRWESCAGCGKQIDINGNGWVMLIDKEIVHHTIDCLKEVVRRKNDEKIPSFDEL